MRVALIHDHLAQDGGAEKVLKVLADEYKEASIYTLLYEQKNADKYYKDRKIETSIIQRLPFGVKHYKWYMPFMPMAVEFFDLRSYNLVISSVSGFAKGVITSTYTPHICYCHTPTRYLWDYTHEYINELNYNKYFKKLISLVLNYMRMWDRLAADRVDFFIANSKTVQKRIKKYYRRDSVVIYPPVDVDRFSISDKVGDYFLIGGRLAPYKRVDIVIKAFKGTDRKLKIFGDGVDLERLKRIAGLAPNIEFLGRVNDAELAELYKNCLAFINPQEEDFGITQVESLASGRPVLAYRRGGAEEIVREGESGLFFDKQTPDDIRKCVERFESLKVDPKRIRQYSLRFSTKRFREEMKEYINRAIEEYKQL